MLSPDSPGFNHRPSLPNGTKRSEARDPGKLALFCTGEKPGGIRITLFSGRCYIHSGSLEIGFVSHNQVSLGIGFL
jgi:hypothetical protein